MSNRVVVCKIEVVGDKWRLIDYYTSTLDVISPRRRDIDTDITYRIYQYLKNIVKRDFGEVPIYLSFEGIGEDVFMLATEQYQTRFIIMDTSEYFKFFDLMYDRHKQATRGEFLTLKQVMEIILENETQLIAYKDGVRVNTNEVEND